MLYRLVILNGDRKGQQITVPEEPLQIGRGPNCALRVNDMEAALMHAVVEHRGGHLVIRDLGTMNRLLVNHNQASQANLKHGDVIEIGRTHFLVQAFVQAEVQSWPAHRRRRALRLAAAATVLIAAGAAARGWWVYAHTPAPGLAAAPPAVTPQGDVPSEAAPAAEPSAAPDAAAQPEPAAALVDAAPQPPPRLPGAAIDPAPPAPAPRVDALADKVAAMMADAGTLAAGAAPARADEVLRSLLMIVPDHLPAYAERARLFARRGMVDPAIEQWDEVARRGPGTPLATEAEDARARLLLARESLMPEYAGRVRIASTEQTRFPASASHRDMRALNVTLQPDARVRDLNAAAVRVEVCFYDRDAASGNVGPSRVAAEAPPITVSGPWAPGEEKTVTATYSVAVDEAGAAGGRPVYYGCAVRVYYYGALQDAWCQPKDLAAQSRGNPPAPAVANQALSASTM